MMKRIAITLGAAVAVVLLMPATPAGAHPLGNLSVNQYVGLTVHPDRVDAEAIVDIAEIPTLQDKPSVDIDGNGTVSEQERTAHAAASCAAIANGVTASVGRDRLQWTVTRSQFGYSAGTGGLDVSRVDCLLTAPATLATDSSLQVANGYLADRIGWREMTATGDGVRLVDSPLPAESASDKLRDYPKDLLSSVLDVRSATVRVAAGSGSDGAAVALTAGGDPVSRWMAGVDRYFQDLAGGDLTPWVGILAVLLAIVLGAGHAVLPGHGKTVLAAYLAGKRGRPRDAVTVAGTVTLTHTGGVLILGAVLTAGTALAGEQILSWLGLVSGVVVLTVGATMLAGVIRRRGAADHGHAHGHSPGAHGHSHDHGSHAHSHHGDHTHTHGDHSHHDHSHGDHSHGDHFHHDHSDHDHSHDDHSHDHGHAHALGIGRSHPHGSSRWSLAGVGIAGGLVPSPSALVVLLAAIGLGRTAFGVLLVVAYGVGMAATLAGAGFLLLVLQRRLERSATPGRLATRLGGLAARINAATPAATAGLVLVVGAGLAIRAAAGVI